MNREMLEQSMGELQVTVEELEKRLDTIDEESETEILLFYKKKPQIILEYNVLYFFCLKCFDFS